MMRLSKGQSGTALRPR